MGIIFFGTSAFAVPILKAVAGSVQLVVSQPDRPTGRGMHVALTPVKQAALELGLPVEAPESCRSPEFIERIASLSADLLLVAAYGQIMPVRLFEATRQGGFNLHGSLLPKYRGAAPIQRCLMDGESKTGVTLMKMAKGMDTGDMIAKTELEIDPNETYLPLQDRLAIAAANLASEWLPRLCSGNYPFEQQEESQATYASKISKEETSLDWEIDGRSAYNQFRGLTPQPGAWLTTSKGRIKIIESRLWLGNQKPGEIVSYQGGVGTAFASNGLILLQVQPEGKRPVSGKDWLNGAHLKLGMNIRPNL